MGVGVGGGGGGGGGGGAGDWRRHRIHYDVIVMMSKHALRDHMWAPELRASVHEIPFMQLEYFRNE